MALCTRAPAHQALTFGGDGALSRACVTLTLAHPTTQSLGGTAYLGCDGRNSCPAQLVLAAGLLNHAHGSITSGEYQNDFFMVARFFQMLEPSSNPARFRLNCSAKVGFVPRTLEWLRGHAMVKRTPAKAEASAGQTESRSAAHDSLYITACGADSTSSVRPSRFARPEHSSSSRSYGSTLKLRPLPRSNGGNGALNLDHLG